MTRCRMCGSRGEALPVQEMVSTPEPKYSTMAPVPPFTVRMPATLQMMSLGEFHLASLPVSFTPITCRRARHTQQAAHRAASCAAMSCHGMATPQATGASRASVKDKWSLRCKSTVG